MGNSDTFTDGLVMIARRENCPYCDNMKIMLDNAGLTPQIVYSDNIRELFISKHKTVPQLYYKGDHIGDYSTLAITHQLGGNDGVKKKALNQVVTDDTGLF